MSTVFTTPPESEIHQRYRLLIARKCFERPKAAALHIGINLHTGSLRRPKPRDCCVNPPSTVTSVPPVESDISGSDVFPSATPNLGGRLLAC